MLEQGRAVPFSSHRVINADQFAEVIERMRINVPSSIRESERTLAERDAILAEAQAEAERIVEEARQRAREIMSRDNIMKAAQNEASRVLEESRTLAHRRTEEADRYATEVLQSLADKLRLISQQVDNGIRMLQGSPAAQALPPNAARPQPEPAEKQG